jgi:hypothetical protein
MTAEFNWWLLLLGLVVGGGLTWLVLAETRRREQDLEDEELPDEAAWIEARIAEEGDAVPIETIERVVQLHRAFLEVVPRSEWPDEEWHVEDWPAEEPTAPILQDPEPSLPDPKPPPAPRDDRGGPSAESSWHPPA